MCRLDPAFRRTPKPKLLPPASVPNFLLMSAFPVSSAFLRFVVVGIYAPAIDGLLHSPGFPPSKTLGNAEQGASFAAGIAVAWTIGSSVLAALLAVVKSTLWRRRKLRFVCVFGAAAIYYSWPAAHMTRNTRARGKLALSGRGGECAPQLTPNYP